MEELEQFRRRHAATIERLYVRSRGETLGVSPDDFADALHKTCLHRFPDGSPDRATSEQFLDSLHVADLVLALACRSGDDYAWRIFHETHRAAVARYARALVRDAARAQELADSLWGDLYGVNAGTRRSPLDHYHGRSALGPWLRAVLAQREADRWRREAPHATVARNGTTDSASVRVDLGEESDRRRYLPLLTGVLACVLDQLDPQDKLRLAYYYVQGLTLAETGELMDEHESTVSRNLRRIRDEIRHEVERRLRRDHRLSEDQIRRCFEHAADDSPFDLTASLGRGK